MASDLSRLRSKLTDRLDKLAHDSMQCPQADPFAHGKQVGEYIAIQAVIEEVTALIKDGEE